MASNISEDVSFDFFHFLIYCWNKLFEQHIKKLRGCFFSNSLYELLSIAGIEAARGQNANFVIYGPISTFEVSKYSYLKNNRGLLKPLFDLRSNNGLSVMFLERVAAVLQRAKSQFLFRHFLSAKFHAHVGNSHITQT